MKHLSTDKYTIAWFKLAEFVSRGEKEKALGIYKLLSLSINDLAFTNKLEGDILFLFNDKTAIEKHYKAAILYQNDKKFIEAAAIFENLFNLYPESQEYLHKLIEIYKKLNFTSNYASSLYRLFLLQLKKRSIDESLETLDKLDTISDENMDNIFEQILFKLIEESFHEKIIQKYLNKIITDYSLKNNRYYLEQFLKKLETVNEVYYTKAIQQLGR